MYSSFPETTYNWHTGYNTWVWETLIHPRFLYRFSYKSCLSRLIQLCVCARARAFVCFHQNIYRFHTVCHISFNSTLLSKLSLLICIMKRIEVGYFICNPQHITTYMYCTHTQFLAPFNSEFSDIINCSNAS